MTSTHLANEKARQQARENAASWIKYQIERDSKSITTDAAGNLYWTEEQPENE